MAQRRMFSNRIVGSGRFLTMPPSAQALYFHLGINADDDGVVEAYKILKLTDSKPDDLKALVDKEFVFVLNHDLVAVILDWREHNLIRADRKVDSVYRDLLMEKLPQYRLLEAKQRADVKRLPAGRPVDAKWAAQVRLGKVRLGKDNKYNTAEVAPPQAFSFEEEIQKLENAKTKDGKDIRHLQVIGLFLKEKKPDIRNGLQLSKAIRRHSRAAKEIADFDNDQIIKGFKEAANLVNGWTIETAIKILTK